MLVTSGGSSGILSLRLSKILNFHKFNKVTAVIDRLISAGKELDMEEEELKKFVTEQQSLEREERAQSLEQMNWRRMQSSSAWRQQRKLMHD